MDFNTSPTYVRIEPKSKSIEPSKSDTLPCLNRNTPAKKKKKKTRINSSKRTWKNASASWQTTSLLSRILLALGDRGFLFRHHEGDLCSVLSGHLTKQGCLGANLKNDTACENWVEHKLHPRLDPEYVFGEADWMLTVWRAVYTEANILTLIVGKSNGCYQLTKSIGVTRRLRREKTTKYH